MVFGSHLFVFYFLPAALLLYYVMPRFGRHLMLTLLSYLFYGWSNPLFIVLMLGSTLIDYLCGLFIAGRREGGLRGPNDPLDPQGPRTPGQKRAVAISVCSNLALLGVFKYFEFGIGAWNDLVSTLGWSAAEWEPFFRLTLPLGISFYTFQSMSYTIDVYRGEARAVRNFIDFACYVSMFPQLVAGPIIRFHEVADQLRQREHTAEKFARGIAFFCFGMAKKVFLANPCGKMADLAFDSGGAHFADAWTGLLGYSFQIYFDFSAYSDMAIGLGLMLGFVFPKNFDSPYRSASITEFWQRWHISLSTWLRDYLYLPLGGNRKSPSRTYVNLMLVMLLGGLWHGASWNFLVWGGIHGLMLVAERGRGKNSFYEGLPRACRVALTFLIVSVAWVFFRADTLPDAVAYCGSLIGLGHPVPGSGLISGTLYAPYHLAALAAAAIVTWLCPQTWDFTRRLSPARATFALLLFWSSLLMLTTESFNPFIYFIF